MAFPTTAVLDDFNRSDENPIAGGWAGPLFSGDNQGQLLSNAYEGAGGGGGGSYWNTSFGPDSEIYCDLVTRADDASYIGLWLRVANPNNASLDGYRFAFFSFSGGDFVRIHPITDGVAGTQIGSDLAIVPNLVAGDGMGVSIEGSTMKAWKRVAGVWSQVGGDQTDSTWTNAGYIAGHFNDGTGVIDNFGGGTVVSGAAPGSGRIKELAAQGWNLPVGV